MIDTARNWGRLGDDGFTIVLYDCTPDDSVVACERLCESIEHEPLVMPDDEVRLSVSCGVVALDPDFSAVETLDVALEAKFREAWF